MKKHKPWTWLFSGIGVAMLSWVLNVWFSELQSQSLEIDSFWQNQVEQMIYEGKLDSPPGNGFNAYDTVRARLNQHPDDPNAKLLVQRISEVFVKQAEIAIDKKQIRHAQRYANKAKVIWPENPYLDHLQNEITNISKLDSLLSVSDKELSKLDVERGKQILSKGKRWALLIANQNYTEGLESLQTPLNTIKILGKVLKDTYGFNIVTIKDSTKNEMLKALYSLQTKINEDDSLLIYYSGHSEQEKGFGGKGFWIPIDGKSPYLESKEYLSSWVPNSIVHDIIRASRAKHVLLISDACFSGTFKINTRKHKIEQINTPSKQNFGSQPTVQMYRLASFSSRRAITSSDLEPVADSDGKGGEHSIFAYYLLKVLMENKAITAAKLFQKIRKPIIKAASQKPQYFIIDSKMDKGGDFIFVPKKIHEASIR